MASSAQISDHIAEILPVNATPLERILASMTARISNVLFHVSADGATPDTICLSDLWDPLKCPTSFLPWLAWGLAVDVWDETLPEEHKRSLIRESISVHKQKGTRASIEKALKVLGVEAHIREWWQLSLKERERLPPKDHSPFLFLVDLYVGENLYQGDPGILGEKMLSLLNYIIDANKPLRSRYKVRVGIEFKQNMTVACSMSMLPVLRASCTLGREKFLHFQKDTLMSCSMSILPLLRRAFNLNVTKKQ